MAPIGKVMSMLPGIPPELLQAGREQEGVDRIKRFMIIMDSMTDEGMIKSSLCYIDLFILYFNKTALKI